MLMSITFNQEKKRPLVFLLFTIYIGDLPQKRQVITFVNITKKIIFVRKAILCDEKFNDDATNSKRCQAQNLE